MADAEADDGREDQRHECLCHAAAGVAPAAHRGIGGADHVRREHDRCVILRDHKTCADDADRQAEDQERGVGPGEGDAEHGDGTESEQQRVSEARAVFVAHGADGHAREDGDADRCNIDVRKLCHGQSVIALDDGHQRRHCEPGEEADEKRHPGEMEGLHLNRFQAEQIYPVCLLSNHDTASVFVAVLHGACEPRAGRTDASSRPHKN